MQKADKKKTEPLGCGLRPNAMKKNRYYFFMIFFTLPAYFTM